MSVSSAPQVHATHRWSESATPSPKRARKASWFDRVLRRMVFHRLEKLTAGRIILQDSDGPWIFGRDLFSTSPHPSPLRAPTEGWSGEGIVVEVHDPRFYRQVAFGGSLGAAEAYLGGFWDCNDPVGLVRIFCRNPAVLAGMETGWARLLSPWHRLAHRLRRNTLFGSRRNIAAHYDLGDDFFRLFLDETMAYSCAYFPHPESTLEEASLAKFDRICRKLDLQPSDHLLDVGGGWGGLALYAAQHFGCRVTATTISQRQYAYTRRIVEQQGLAERVRVLCEDYRRVPGAFDKLASIGMIEHVGHQYLDTYFRACSARLKPGGLMLLQTITIPDQYFQEHCRGEGFIQRYIFPGGCLPSLGAICRAAGQAADLRIIHLDDQTLHYARTLAEWRKRFWENQSAVRALGFDEAFLRTWDYYFCSCEGGFRERSIGNVQILFTKLAAAV
jgi:cyclopropane-fatty-acyl-phospholipid synthase